MIEKISVCICTYHRNQMLERLLRNLSRQETSDLFTYSAVIVDNDAEGNARETVMRLRPELAFELEYAIEPTRTIPAARNRAIIMAQGNYVAIIDDDEIPPPGWLATMYRTIHTFDVDGVLGPVHPFFAEKPPAWLIKSGVCERPVYRTGTILAWHQTRTGNVLVKKKVFDEHGLHFDLKWKTSGSDRAFFLEAIKLGYRFAAVEEAPVYEIVPPERWRLDYYLKRSLVHGYNSQRNNPNHSTGLFGLFSVARSIGVVLLYLIALPFAAIIGKHSLVRCLEGGGHHFSRLCALVNFEPVKKRDF